MSHLFIFCFRDAAIVFAETAESADVAAADGADKVTAGITDENSDPASETAQGEDSQQGSESDSKKEEPTALDNNAGQSQNNSAGFNLNALQSLQPSLFTGALTYSVPIAVPPGRKGIQPNVALTYSSQSGNGILGMGWVLDLGSIERSTKNGVPKYNSTDTFIFKSGGSTQELVYIGGNEYHAKIEEAFMKFTFNGSYWVVKDKSGITYRFGYNADSQQNNGSNIFKWCLDNVEDTLGNYMTLTYIKDSGEIYPNTIDYTGYSGSPALDPAFQVDFDYLNSRDDYFFSYRSNFLIKTNKLLSTVTVKQNGSRIRRYALSYQQSPSTKRKLFSSITQYGLNDSSSLPPITFTYQQKPFTFSSIISWGNIHNFGNNDWTGIRATGTPYTYVDILDINRDGLLDRVFRGYNDPDYTKLWVQINNGSSFDNLIAWSDIAAQSGQTDRASIRYAYSHCYMNTFDINGDALPDRIHTNYNGYNQWEVEVNNGNGFNSSLAWTNIDGFNDPGDYTRIWGYNYDPPVWGSKDLFDINGDGKPDRVIGGGSDPWYVQLNTGSNSFNNSIEWLNAQYDTHISESYIRTGGDSVYFTTFDINGDGLPDHCMNHDSGDWEVQFNNGSGFENIQMWGPIEGASGSWQLFYKGSPMYVSLNDINGDGLPDRVMRNYNDTFGPWMVQINNGHGFEPIVEWGPIIHNNDSDRAHITAGYNPTTVDFFDINGDGLPDRVMRALNTPYDHWDVQLNQGPAPDLLSTISNGIGGQAAAAYDTYIGHDNSEQSDRDDLGFPVNVVTQIQTTDGRGSSYSTSYSYDKGKFDYAEREFRGFGKVQVTDVDGNYSLSYFKQGDYDKGRPDKQESYNSSGIIQTKSESTWNIQDNIYPGYPDSKFIYLSESNSYTYNNGTATKRIKSGSVYGESPQYGNPTQIIEYGEVNVDTGEDIGEDKRITETEYTYNETDWIVALPCNVQVFDINNNKVSEKKFYYDNHPSITAEPTDGLLTKEEVWCKNPITQNENWIFSQYNYNGYGNLVSATDANSHTTTTTYDGAYYIYPLTVANHLGHTVITQYYGIDGVPLDDGNGFKGLFGQTKSTQDPNGVISRSTYDDLGRLEKSIGPNDTIDYPGAIYGYDINVTDPINDPVKITNKVKAVNSPSSTNYPDYYDSYSFYDGMGRQILSKSPAEPDPNTGAQRQIVSGIVEYNNRGMVDKKYLPYFVGSSPNFIQPNFSQPYASFDYDCLGRVTRTTNPGNNGYSESSYSDWQVIATDENDNYHTYYYDAYQRLIQVDEHNGQTYTTTYTYDILGNLITLTDNQNNATAITYDSLGRKIRMNDPDMGTWNYEYDNVGNLTKQIDAAGQELVFTYDAINRLIQKTIQATQNVNYQYDDLSKNYCKGRLSKVTYEAGQTEFFYDNLGREIQSIKTVDSTLYTVNRTYDVLDRLSTLTYPDGEVVTYTYNPQGIETVTGSTGTTYITNINYSPTGQIAKIQYGNGTETNYNYNPQTLRLTQLQTTNNQLQTIQHLEYNFDNAGNILGITDSINNGTQSFAYDNLNRLTSANGASYGAINYAYDSIGNMQTKGALTLNYNNTRPHAVSSYTNSQTLQTVNFTYDANGNMSNRANAQTGEQANYFYDYESHLTKVEQVYPEGQQMSVNLEFETGWNFFCLPLNPTNSEIQQIFSGLQVGTDFDQISRYDPTTDDFDNYVGNPDSNNTKLLLHGDSSTGLSDNSSFNHSISANGSAQINSAQFKFGDASIKFDGDSDYLTSPDSDDWAFGTGDWTIDFWVKFNVVESVQFIGQRQNVDNQWWLKYNNTLHRLMVLSYIGGATQIEGSVLDWTPSEDIWYHIAWERSGDTTCVFINGIQQTLTNNTASGSLSSIDSDLYIGDAPAGGESLNGWIDELIISKGVARWASNFTVPQAPYDLGSQFDEFDTLEYGKGYAIYVTNPNGLNVTVTGTAPEPQGINLAQGWNLIPYPYLSSSSIQEGLGNLQSGVDYSEVRYYTGINQYTSYPGSLSELDPNKSYYINILPLQGSTWNLETLSRATEFYYDGDGGRVKKVSEIDQAETTTYIGSLFEKIDYSDPSQITVIKKHIYAGANRVCVVDDGNLRYYHGDHLGSSNIITDGTGTQVARYEYSPFGEISTSIENPGTSNKYLYTGKEKDDTGLYYYGARYYDPVIGRFISPDTIVQAPSDPQSLNRYAYCRNNPIKYVDPTGRWFWAALIVGAILGGASAASNNQPIWQGALLGAAGGLMVGGGAAAFGFWGAVGGGILAGAGNAAATGGNIGFGALTGGLGAGLGYGLGSWASGWESGSFWGELGGAMMAGAVAGGVGAELAGGKFGQGAWMGAAYGSAGFFGSKGVNGMDPRIRQARERQQEARARHALNSKKTDMIKIPVGRRPVSFFKPAGHEFLPGFEMGPDISGGNIQTSRTVGNLSKWPTHIETQDAIASGTAQFTTAEVSASGLVDSMQWYEQGWVDTNTRYSGGSFNSNYAINTVIYSAGGSVPNAPGWNPSFGSVPNSVFYPYAYRED